MSNIVAIIQARMGSTRLPGKVLKEVMGKPLLAYQLERLADSKKIDQIVIATTEKVADDQIVTFCKEMNITYYRGSENDVLSRYYEAAKQNRADIVVRITSDCPIIDPEIVDEVIGRYLKGQYDYVSNTLERTYPRGLDTEVFSFQALKKAQLDAKERYEREHVTPYIYLKQSKFRLNGVSNSINESSHRWTVDTIEDFELIKRIITHFYPTKKNFRMKEVLSLLNDNPEWVKINAEIEQKKLGE